MHIYIYIYIYIYIERDTNCLWNIYTDVHIYIYTRHILIIYLLYNCYIAIESNSGHRSSSPFRYSTLQAPHLAKRMPQQFHSLYLSIYLYLYLCMYIYIYIYIVYLSLYLSLSLYIYIYIYIYFYIYIYICIYMYVYIYIYMYVYIYIYIYMYISLFIYIYIYIYIYTHTHTYMHYMPDKYSSIRCCHRTARATDSRLVSSAYTQSAFVVAIFYPFSQFCEIDSSLLTLQNHQQQLNTYFRGG